MEISPSELHLLSNYAASELKGALILGDWARKSKDSYVHAKLTWHCAEEARHASLVTDTILAVGAQPLEVHDTDKSHYYTHGIALEEEIEQLAFVYTFERMVPFHYSMHLERSNIHPKVRETLKLLIQDESDHLAWVRNHFDAYKKQGNGSHVESAILKFENVLRNIYRQEVLRMQHAGQEMEEFAAIITRNLLPWLKSDDLQTG